MKKTLASMGLLVIVPLHMTLHILLDPLTTFDVWLCKWAIYLLELGKNENNDRN